MNLAAAGMLVNISTRQAVTRLLAAGTPGRVAAGARVGRWAHAVAGGGDEGAHRGRRHGRPRLPGHRGRRGTEAPATRTPRSCSSAATAGSRARAVPEAGFELRHPAARGLLARARGGAARGGCSSTSWRVAARRSASCSAAAATWCSAPAATCRRRRRRGAGWPGRPLRAAGAEHVPGLANRLLVAGRRRGAPGVQRGARATSRARTASSCPATRCARTSSSGDRAHRAASVRARPRARPTVFVFGGCAGRSASTRRRSTAMRRLRGPPRRAVHPADRQGGLRVRREGRGAGALPAPWSCRT